MLFRSIGENSAEVRAACCHGLDWLGVTLDPAANSEQAGDRRVSSGRVQVLALATNEELIVARRAWRKLKC